MGHEALYLGHRVSLGYTIWLTVREMWSVFA
jgi:hypothetical protein